MNMLSMDYTLVTIVIVTWNKRAEILTLLNSLLAIRYSCASTVVVDNASTDGSVEAIRSHSLSVTLLENRENLGGTGGFNVGIRHALELSNQEFIWLLDNDAEVTPSTLHELLEAMATDQNIGIAGSCILNPEDPTLIVEAGGFVDSGNATWRPNLRYIKYSEYSGRGLQLDVDYVPACSALVRADVFKKVGILDERFFLHWDDVDFCARVREAGHKVVAVMDSKVYHGVEKGYSSTGIYYDLRNALLYFSKRPGSIKRMVSIFKVVLNASNLMFYFCFLKNKQMNWFVSRSVKDFLQGRFGKAPTSPEISTIQNSELLPPDKLHGCNKVIVFAVGSQADITRAIGKIANLAPHASITLAVSTDRVGAYSHIQSISHFIEFNLAREGLRKGLINAMKILFANYDYGISAGTEFTIPYAFFVRKNFVYEGMDDSLRSTNISIINIWKLPVATILGVLKALCFVFPVLFKASKYRAASNDSFNCKSADIDPGRITSC